MLSQDSILFKAVILLLSASHNGRLCRHSTQGKK
jgi:hypothetical protein